MSLELRLPNVCAIRLYLPGRFRSHQLDLESDGDLVTNQNAAGFECCIPDQAEILSVDRCNRRDRHTRVAPGILRSWRWPFNRKVDLAGNAMNCQVALDRVRFLATRSSVPNGAVSDLCDLRLVSWPVE